MPDCGIRDPKACGWRVAVCIASGPSLTAEDCERVREWRNSSPQRAAICTNTTFRLTPWADALWAMDKVWWERYAAEAKANFCGELLTLSANPFGIKTARIEHYRNSGGGAVSLAIARGAKRIILTGYDMQKTNGQSHWHGDHPKGLGSAGKIAEWPSEFERLKRTNPTIEIINCTRETALTCFARRPLEDALNEPDPA
ncbi:hypothetical protein EVV10_26355 [Pseudomonas aeruginosa]|nr:hypothetical protein EVV10_26355 [Pseudomonas aeruginosa]